MVKEKLKRTLIKIVKTTWVVVGILFLLWLCYSMQSHNINKKVYLSNHKVSFKYTSDYYSYTPQKEFDKVLIFYPGALVDTKAYLPLCQKIAENGIKVYLIKMPWRQSKWGYNKPKTLDIFEDTSKKYFLAGHSQGGKMAAQFVYENPTLIDRLILIGTSHPRDISLRNCTIPILKIYGSKDGVASELSIKNNVSKLPKQTKFEKIIGANHSQFGYYGFQLGDHSATISRALQQTETLKHIIAFIGK